MPALLPVPTPEGSEGEWYRYVITQGGPLQSTVSVLYLMYEEGFKWWNLGNASAVAFLLFLLMTATTSGMLWFARRRGAEE